MTKYHNHPVDVDGYHFDSQAEAVRYQELRLLERAGEIESLEVHPVYKLQPSFTLQGKRIREITYEADFFYVEHEQAVAEDVKGGRGTQTDVFKIKAKMFQYHYPHIELRIVER